MILDDIKNALETVDPLVFYGKASGVSDGDLWNYIVFSRNSLNTTGGGTGIANSYHVAIVRENFIPEETVRDVIDAMCGLAGMRLTGSEFSYQYAAKPKTNTIVELLVMEFAKPRKR